MVVPDFDDTMKRVRAGSIVSAVSRTASGIVESRTVSLSG